MRLLGRLGPPPMTSVLIRTENLPANKDTGEAKERGLKQILSIRLLERSKLCQKHNLGILPLE
jgi:hypothetical protein